MTQVIEAPPSSPLVGGNSTGVESSCNTGDEKTAMIQKVKQEVKRLMEEAVTRKFIHEDSSSVRSLCGVVDQCLTHKLKKSVASPFSIGGLWNGGAMTTTGKAEFSASLSLVSKLCKQLGPTAELKQQLTDILCQVQDKQNAYKIMMKNSNAQNGQGSVSWAIQEFPSDRALKFLWMRLSLFAGILDRVIDQICKESSKFYEKDAFMCDPVVTTLLISLMVGPCSLDYSKAKTPDHLWTDPHAEELVLKHKIHSNIGYTSSQMNSANYESGSVSNPDARRALLSNNFKTTKPALMSIETGNQLNKPEDNNSCNSSNVNRSSVSPSPMGLGSTQLSVDSSNSPVSLAHSPKDYVDSLHQNNKETLIYGKNNVKVQPTCDLEPMLGYLSLHQSTASPNSINLKRTSSGKQSCWLQLQWTPNDVMSVPSNRNQASANQNESNVQSNVDKENQAVVNSEHPDSGDESLKSDQNFDMKKASESSTRSNVINGSSGNQNIDRDVLWKYAMSVDMRDILYLHCHQMAASKKEYQNQDAIVSDARQSSLVNEINSSDITNNTTTINGSSYASMQTNTQAQQPEIEQGETNSNIKSAPLASQKIEGNQSQAEDDEEGDILVLVGHDGVSLPPITFPPSSQPGGHLLSFLSCLENALLPQAQLEPPLWTHRGKGKVFPRLYHSTDSNGSISEEPSPIINTVASNNIKSEEKENNNNAGCTISAATAAPDKDIIDQSPKKRPFEKYILSVSLSNPIGELVSSTKLFESINKPESSNSANSTDGSKQAKPGSGQLSKSHSVAEAEPNRNEKKESKEANQNKEINEKIGVKKLVESRDFVFRIVHQHEHVYNSAANSSGGGVPQGKQIAVGTPPVVSSLVGGQNPSSVSASIISHFSFSQSAILGQKNLLREAANMTVEKQSRPKLQHQPGEIESCKSGTESTDQLAVFGDKLEASCEPAAQLVGNLTSATDMLLLKNAVGGGGEKENIEKLCYSMKRQILARAFYGWLTYVRHLKTVRTHLSCLVSAPRHQSWKQEAAEGGGDKQGGRKVSESELAHQLWAHDLAKYNGGLSVAIWNEWDKTNQLGARSCDILKYIYYGGMEHSLRSTVWLYLLGHYPLENHPQRQSNPNHTGAGEARRNEIDARAEERYERVLAEWQLAEKEYVASKTTPISTISPSSTALTTTPEEQSTPNKSAPGTQLNFDDPSFSTASKLSSSAYDTLANITEEEDNNEEYEESYEKTRTTANRQPINCDGETANLSIDLSAEDEYQYNPASYRSSVNDNEVMAGGGGSELNIRDKMSSRQFDADVLSALGLNLHRIDKDVARCDRNHAYFAERHNLDKLRRIMCSYVWENLDVGYVQGMCDIVAPLLVIFDDESKTFSAFSLLMVRMRENFPQGRAMDQHFSNMRALLQILDPGLFEHMQQHGDYTHFYFCYRWFLLDFKRELKYNEVFWLWETIWAASRLDESHSFGGTQHFVLFVALALLKMYRKIIINYKMDFTDIIKFFNEMAECHKVDDVLLIARDLVMQLHTMLESK